MKSRVAVISIIIEKHDSIESLNKILSETRDYIIGRMGIPYREKGVSIICIVMDAPEDVINSLAGKIGKFDGISAKINYSNVIS